MFPFIEITSVLEAVDFRAASTSALPLPLPTNCSYFTGSYPTLLLEAVATANRFCFRFQNPEFNASFLFFAGMTSPMLGILRIKTGEDATASASDAAPGKTGAVSNGSIANSVKSAPNYNSIKDDEM